MRKLTYHLNKLTNYTAIGLGVLLLSNFIYFIITGEWINLQ